MPMCFHTGYLVWEGAHSRADACLLESLIAEHTETLFVLFHINFPWCNDLLAMMLRQPNIVADCSWAPSLCPAAMRDFLRHAVGVLPADRIIAFGSEGAEWEYLEAFLGQARAIVAASLTNSPLPQASEQQALNTARQWLFDTPRAVYQLTV